MSEKIKISKILLIIGIITAVYIAGRLFAFHQLEKVIRQELADLENQGIEVTVEGLKVGPWQNRVQLDSVFVQFSEGYGQNNFVQASSGAITLKGISLLKAVLNKKLHINSVQITHPSIQTMIEQEGKSQSQQVRNSQNPALKSLFVKHLEIKEGKWRLNDNTDTPVRVTTLDEIHLTNVFIANKTEGPLEWRVGKTNVSTVSIDIPKNMHTYFVQSVYYDADAKALNFDTIKIIPHYNKTEFAQKAGKEFTRLSVLLPYVTATECDLKSNPRFTLNAKEVKLKMHLQSYYDKRPPFENPANKVLPIEFMRHLPILLHIDTLRLENSYAEHEEFPEVGEETGKIFFSKLNVTIANITTDTIKDEKKLPTMSATAMFMGVGDLRAEFSFPSTPNGVYYASGAMYNFPMTKLNQATEPLAKAKIESGDLKWVKFNFKYTDDRSDGELEMNYKDLKVTILKKDDPNKKAGFVNFLLNTFILKEDLDETKEKEKRTGTIQFYRDRRRALFYYWWKSVLSGVLSTYHIDKVPQPKDLTLEERKDKMK